jgi:hypothetical protein
MAKLFQNVYLVVVLGAMLVVNVASIQVAPSVAMVTSLQGIFLCVVEDATTVAFTSAVTAESCQGGRLAAANDVVVLA